MCLRICIFGNEGFLFLRISGVLQFHCLTAVFPSFLLSFSFSFLPASLSSWGSSVGAKCPKGSVGPPASCHHALPRELPFLRLPVVFYPPFLPSQRLLESGKPGVGESHGFTLWLSRKQVPILCWGLEWSPSGAPRSKETLVHRADIPQVLESVGQEQLLLILLVWTGVALSPGASQIRQADPLPLASPVPLRSPLPMPLRIVGGTRWEAGRENDLGGRCCLLSSPFALLFCYIL